MAIQSKNVLLQYDLNGNLLYDETRAYSWDAKNRLKSVTQNGITYAYEYDSQDRRVIERENGVLIKYFIWEGLTLVQEQDANHAPLRTYYAQGERVGNLSVFYLLDHQRTIQGGIDISGQSRAVYIYTPWGSRTKTAGDLDLVMGYTGHYQGGATGLVFAPYRGYDPEIGRWLNHDPIKELGGMNLYKHVGNNSINFWDPLGLEDFRMFPPGEVHKEYDAGADVYDIGAHGHPKAIIDEYGRELSPQQLLDRIKDDPKLQNAKRVQIWACEVGKGKDSFAQLFADLSGKPTSGPNQIFWEEGRNGTVAPYLNGKPPKGIFGFLGRMISWNWKQFMPQKQKNHCLLK